MRRYCIAMIVLGATSSGAFAEPIVLADAVLDRVTAGNGVVDRVELGDALKDLRGAIFDEREGLRDAIADYRQAILADPADPQMALDDLRGAIIDEREGLHDAIAEFRQAILDGREDLHTIWDIGNAHVMVFSGDHAVGVTVTSSGTSYSASSASVAIQ